jgi:hypothetical protein
MINFTAQETRLVNALGDGRPHPESELIKLLWDEFSGKDSLKEYMKRIRAKLLPYSQYIYCIRGKNGEETCYIHLVRKPYNLSLAELLENANTCP